MRKALTALLLVSLCAPALADPPSADAKKIYAALKEIHTKAPPIRKSNQNDLRACVAAMDGWRSKAMAMRGRVQKLDASAYSGAFDDAMDLGQAADQAMSCTYCASDGKTCPALGATLKKVDTRWKAQAPK